MKTLREVTPLEGIREAIGNGAEVIWAQGYPSYGAQERFKRVSPQMAPDRKLLAEAVKIARKADVVIFVAGDNREIETEGSDRVSIKMPQGQNEVAKALAAANKNLVTVIVAGGLPVVLSSWRRSETLPRPFSFHGLTVLRVAPLLAMCSRERFPHQENCRSPSPSSWRILLPMPQAPIPSS